MTNKAIFSPIKVGNSQLKHRVVLAPLTRYRASLEAVPSDLQVEYYRQRASEGGLLITEGTLMTRLAGGQSQAPGIFNKEQVEAWKKVTAAVHEKKGFIFVQLWHLGRAGTSVNFPNNEQLVAPSAIPIKNSKNYAGYTFEQPRALEIEEIKDLVQEYRKAALNAIEAGFDGVEIHSANGYLLDEFLSSGTNQRTDKYGGHAVENRARFPLEVIDAVVDAVGAERTAIRFSPGTIYQDMFDEEPVKTWGYVTEQIQEHHPDLAYLHFVEANARYRDESHINDADSLDTFRQVWKGPFISAGGHSTNPQHAIDLAEKTGSLISFGRSFISNPDLPERLLNNWELNPFDRDTFYTHDAHGYIDYPFYNNDKK